jgi:transcriptional regulator with XRE-family HTH domain
MGRSARPRPKQLAKKLLKIRHSLELSQDEMLAQLGLAEGRFRSAVSGYELGTREPPLPVLLTYAKLAGVWVDMLIDDGLELPEKLPADQRKRRQGR